MNDATFVENVEAIEQEILRTRQALRAATYELNARQGLIEGYRQKNYAHERMVGKLLELLDNDDMDGARDLVKAEYDSIHGPND